MMVAAERDGAEVVDLAPSRSRAEMGSLDRARAAAIDGARPWQIFTRITIPLLKPILIIAVLFRSLDAFKIFDKIFIITNGGPGTATELISMYTFRLNFLHWHLGYGAAAVIVVYLLVLAVTSVFQKLVFARQT